MIKSEYARKFMKRKLERVKSDTVGQYLTKLNKVFSQEKQKGIHSDFLFSL